MRLTSRADVFERSGSSHAEGVLELSDQLPSIQRIAQVDEPGRTVDD